MLGTAASVIVWCGLRDVSVIWIVYRMFAGEVSPASGIWQVPVIAPEARLQGNALGPLRPPPPLEKLIGVPSTSTGVKVTFPVAIVLPPPIER